jgi:hypothetical protein
VFEAEVKPEVIAIPFVVWDDAFSVELHRLPALDTV